MSDLGGKTILLVEDEAILAMEQASVLEAYDLVVETAHSADQAFRTIAERHIDLVLMDIDLGAGRMDGIEAARRILTGRDVPVVFLSGHTEPEVISRAEDVTSYGYVVKNCSETVLIAALRMAFRLHRAHARLRASEETFRRLFESMVQGVAYHDRSGKVVGANAAAARILGLTHEQLMGKDSYDPRWKAMDENGDPFPGEYHPAMVALRTGMAVERRLMGVFRPEADDYLWISVSAVPEFRPGESDPYRAFATFEDVTAQHQMAELQESNRRFLETVIDSIQDFISIQDPNLRIQGVNHHVREMYRHHEPLIGKLCYEVYHGRTEPCTNCPTHRAIEHKTVQREVLSLYAEAGGTHWFELSAHPVVAPDGSVRAVVEHGRDVTEMVQEKQATQRALASKSTLLREVHHRMKNNMSIVAGLLALKSHHVDDPDCRAILQDAQNRLGSVQALYERLQSSDEYTVVEMRGYLGDVVRELSEAYRDRGVVLRPSIEHIELPVETAVCVGIVVNELVTNAAKYAYPERSDGTVYIQVRAADADQVELLVSDDGVGMPHDAVEGQSSGFGLAMARGLIGQLSGTFVVETAPGAGSRFLMRFPRGS